MRHTTPSKNIGPERTRAGTAGAFLAPRLFAGATHLTAILGLRRARSLGGHIGYHGVMHGLIALALLNEIKANSLLACIAA